MEASNRKRDSGPYAAQIPCQGSGITGTTSIEAGTSLKAPFHVKVAIAIPCAGIAGTIVPEAAMISFLVLRTITTTCTFVSFVTLVFRSVASMRGISAEPLCIVFETVGIVRGSVVMMNQSGKAGSIVRKAFTAVCFPDTMPG